MTFVRVGMACICIFLFATTVQADPPASVDWRTNGAVTPVKDQGQCESSWAFSATGAIEGAHFLSTKKLTSLSEQQLVDCSAKNGNDGCDGGLPIQAFQYVRDNKGIDTESTYPYEGKINTCQSSAANVGATVSGFKNVPAGDETALLQAVAAGPVSAAIDGSHSSFQLYKQGIYDEPSCSATDLNHYVLIVGYGTDQSTGQPYWIIKNSFGTGWGMQGYMLMIRGKNMCGIATAASYPTT